MDEPCGETKKPANAIRSNIADNKHPVNIKEARCNSITLHPNPTTNILFIEAEEITSIKVYDQIGRLVSSHGNTNMLDFSSLSSGVYTLHITQNQGLSVQKVLKK